LANLTTAYLLVSHGSRDPRPQATIAVLAQHLSEVLACPVGWAILEFGQASLAVQIQQFADRQQVERIYLLPLFLSSGMHVCDDIPEQVAIARSGLSQETEPQEASLSSLSRVKPFPKLVTLPHLGTAIDFARSAWERMQQYPEVDAWMTIAHGSRRVGGNAEIEAIATRIQSQLSCPHRVAYWSQAGQLSEQIHDLLARGHQTIGVLPHFLFPGRLTDAIHTTIQTIAAQSPEARFVCLKTWGEADEWTHSLVDWIIEATQSDRSVADSSNQRTR
jgi:sirohydrochlorin cobaltochelatase